MSISSRERSAVRLIFLIFLAAITLPYLWAWFITPVGSTWSGLLWKVDDQNVHLSWARQAQLGHLFFRDLFTTESLQSGESPRFFNVLPALIGVLARLVPLPLVVWYQVVRVAASLWALWQLYRLTHQILPTARGRLLALALLAFTTGTGILAVLLPALGQKIIFLDHPDPPGFPTMPEAFFFTSALVYPLNAVSYGLLAWMAGNVLRVLQSEGESCSGAGWQLLVGGLLLSNIHTYDALPFLGLLVLCLLLFWKRCGGGRLAPLGLAFLGLIIPVLYQVLVFRDSLEFREKALTLTLAPAPWHVVATLAPLLLLAAWSWSKNRGSYSVQFMALWAAVVLVCIYTPGLSFARKMLEGAHIPLCMLAAVGLSGLLRGPAPQWVPRLAVAVCLVLPGASAGYFTLWCLQNAAENNSSRFQVLMPPLYLAEEEWAALQFVDEQAAGDARVVTLCLPFVGSYGPRTTGSTFYLSHWAETLRFEAKVPRVASFYRGGMSASEAQKFLTETGCRFVLLTQYERGLGGSEAIMQNYGLQQIFTKSGTNSTVAVYKVPILP